MMNSISRLLILLGGVALALGGCNGSAASSTSNAPSIKQTAPQSGPSCSVAPAIDQTIEQLTSCLDPTASVEEIEQTLRLWDRIDDEWGGVGQADVAPGGDQEIIISYYPERVALTPVQGKFAVLKRNLGQWNVLYDQSLEADDNTPWRYEVAGVTDVTGDGYDDLLVRLIYISRHYYGIRRVVLLTAHPNQADSQIHVAFSNEERYFDTSYSFKSMAEDQPPAIQTVEKFDQYHIMTRTYSFDGDSFDLIEEATFPQTAADIPAQYRLGYDSERDRHIYRCDKQDDGSSFQGRICGMKTDGSQQQVVIDDLVSSILASPDGRWLVFAAAPEGFRPTDCQNNLYKMPVAGQPTPLVSAEALRICAIHNLEWQSEGDKLWVQFRNWNGSGPSNEVDSMPVYRVDFETGTLQQN